MMQKLLLLSAVAGLVLNSTSRAAEATNAPASSSNSSLTRAIACKGNSSVPMTSDQEQALPLKLVANLQCGQEVAVLSDLEGYTVNVRTTDGKNGYVARLFLMPAAARTNSSGLGNAPLNRGVAHWQAGSAGSAFFPSGNIVVESLTASGITVQVSMQDTGWKLRANIAVMNAGAEPVYVLPRLLSLDELTPRGKVLRYEETARLAKATNHQLLWGLSTAGPALAQSDASSPANAALPNFFAQYDALEETTGKNRATFVNVAQGIDALSLHEGTLKPGELTAGVVWFERDGKPQQLLLRVPVGNAIFEFPLAFNNEK